MTNTFEAYYFTIDATGEPLIDAILEAVAAAGHGSHHTRGWQEEGLVTPIEDAAKLAAAGLDILRSAGEVNVELLAALKKAANFIGNTEGELGITLDSGDAARAAIAKAEGRDA